MKFQYHPEAAKELIKAIEYYEDKSEGLGADFLDDVEYAITQVLTYPKSGILLTHQDRRILLHTFPYEIIYEISGDVITINAVKHLKRKPGYWKKRK